MIAVIGNLIEPVYGPDFSASRFHINEDDDFSNLTILETVAGDEGMYHCAQIGYFNIQWSAWYLLFEGKNALFLPALLMLLLNKTWQVSLKNATVFVFVFFLKERPRRWPTGSSRG